MNATRKNTVSLRVSPSPRNFRWRLRSAARSRANRSGLAVLGHQGGQLLLHGHEALLAARPGFGRGGWGLRRLAGVAPGGRRRPGQLGLSLDVGRGAQAPSRPGAPEAGLLAGCLSATVTAVLTAVLAARRAGLRLAAALGLEAIELLPGVLGGLGIYRPGRLAFQVDNLKRVNSALPCPGADQPFSVAVYDLSYLH